MKRDIHYLEYLFCHLLIVFVMGRIGFILNNTCVQSITPIDAIGACLDGLLGHDIFVAAYLLALPWLLGLLALRWPGLRLRACLAPYFVVMGFVVAVITEADAVMYEYWQFKLGAVILSYAASPEGTTNSVSTGYILARVGVLLAYVLWIVVPAIWLTPKRLPADKSGRFWLRNISIIWLFLLVGGCFMKVGDVYGERHALLANSAAVNPTYHFASTIRLTDDYAARYDYFTEAEREDLFRGLYPVPADDVQDTLLNTERPDILVVFMESFGSRFVEELGGLPDVAPGWSRLIPEGIFWQNYYNSSFRTDRGTVSAFSGCLSYPDVGLMKQREFHSSIPSLARSLGNVGYETTYLYGGAMTNMGKRQYLEDMDFQTLLDNTAFTPEEQDGSWGVNDSTAAMKACHLVSGWQPGKQHFMVLQTLSSHEPWDVPYHRLEDKRLNAFAYTDNAIAQMVDSLRQLPQWDNLLVIMLPDHGYLYEQNYDDPGFFHAPMLWTGGAVRGARRMDVIMNQSDIAATLLSQMGVSHDEYTWSRNVLSQTYTYPFAYCNYPAGVLFADSTGVSIYDLSGEAPMTESPADGGLRILRAKAILQTSYDQLTPSTSR